MTNYKQLIIGVVVGIILAIGGSLLISHTSMATPSLGAVGVGEVQTNTFWFYNGFYAGTNQQLSVAANGVLVDTGPVAAFNGINQAVSGWSSTLSTSTTLTAGQFCATTHQRWIGTTALATETLPTALAAYQACGSTAGFGAYNGNLITNDSTNTLNIVAGTGMKFECETQGVGTSTIVGGCTASQVSILASDTAEATGYWDGSSSVMDILWGNNWQ